jgi:hypothetical protein
VKEQIGKRMMSLWVIDKLLQLFLKKIAVDTSLIPALYLPHFLTILIDLKPEAYAN